MSDIGYGSGDVWAHSHTYYKEFFGVVFDGDISYDPKEGKEISKKESLIGIPSNLRKHFGFDNYENNSESWSPKKIRYTAHSLTRKKLIHWSYAITDIIPEIVKYANIYSKIVKDKVIILGNDENVKILKIPYITRFSDDYISKIKKDLRKLFIQLENSNYKYFQFMTITTNPNIFGSLNDAFEYLSKSWNILLTRIRKKHPDVFVIKTIEIQKNGFPHLHVLIAVIGYIPISWIRKTAMLNIQFIKLKYLKGYNSYGTYRYILKYILKSIGELKNIDNKLVGDLKELDWNFVQRAVLWAMFSRSYSTSRLSLISLENGFKKIILLFSISLLDKNGVLKL